MQHLKATGRRYTFDRYGWNVDEDNIFVENEDEQEWIESIHARFHEDGIKVSKITRELNTCEVPTKRGGEWSHKQVSRIISN